MEPKVEERSEKSARAFQEAVRRYARYTLGREWGDLEGESLARAVALALREWVVEPMLETERRYERAGAKRLYYLSMEFLMGRCLSNNLRNLGVYDLCRGALDEMGIDLEEMVDLERDPALGNGGLGRLAACFLDSLATLDMPGSGYGINYEFGLFRQAIDNGHQVEKPDRWGTIGDPWLLERPEEAVVVPIYGRVEHGLDGTGTYNPTWLDWQVLVGVPADMPVVGYGGRTVNRLRLFSARSSDEIDMGTFNDGDYLRAVERKVATETISKVLYPSDAAASGRELRLIQEYFLVACAVRDIVRHYQRRHEGWDAFPTQVAIQLNDTHPALTVAELMRVFVDEGGLEWDEAWGITTATLGYTNHTLMPEALERWPAALLDKVLPRHLQIIYEINHRFLGEVAQRWPGDLPRLARMSIVEEGPERHVRMAWLSIVGSHSINGVAAMHSDLIRTSLAADFHALWPERFNNKTNGITQRRWLLHANPGLAELITQRIGDGWITDLDRLRDLEEVARDGAFQTGFAAVKRANKEALAAVIREQCLVRVDPEALFDLQIKRIHEYKRQLLHVMHVVHEYLTLVEDRAELPAPRVHVFAGKAAPRYWAAKQIIKLIHNVGRVVNSDRRVADKLKVVFLPDYRVSLAEKLIPAGDLSEQISTAGTEASGTGNMKLAVNGAVTIGTLDGANIEIRNEVGEENILIFGLTAEEILAMKATGSYHPRALYERFSPIRRVLDAFRSDRFCPKERGLFRWIFDALVDGGDPYFHLADFESYRAAQQAASRLWLDRSLWTRTAIVNVARMGKFSSDRTVAQYAREIWGIKSAR